MTDDALNLLLLGKTGNGKSSTGNSILGRRAFQTSASSCSVTEKVACEYTEMDGQIIKVVDAPGSDCLDRSNMERDEMLTKNNIQALSMCNGGVDAFILVIRFGCRFTQVDLSAVESLSTMFGRNYVRHMIVVVTCGDCFQDYMEEEGWNISFLDWCQQQQGAFRHLFDECHGRFLLFNNREKGEAKMLEQRKLLINLADDLRKRYGRYVSKNFTFAKELRERASRESGSSVLKEAIQQRISLLSAEIEHLHKDPSDSTRKQIQQRIQDLKEEIESEDRGDSQTNNLRELVDRIEQNLSDVSSILELSRELENIRGTKMMFSLMGSGFTIAGGALGLLVPFVGAVVAFTGALSTIAGRIQIDSKEKEIQDNRKEIMEKRLQPKSLFPENKEREFQRQNKDD